MSSQAYASYLASSEENPQHREHIYQFQTLFTMICKEQIDEYLETRIEPIINNAVNKAISSAFSGAMNGIELDVERIVNITIDGLSNQFNSREVDKFFADALGTELRKALSNIDVSLIIS